MVDLEKRSIATVGFPMKGAVKNSLVKTLIKKSEREHIPKMKTKMNIKLTMLNLIKVYIQAWQMVENEDWAKHAISLIAWMKIYTNPPQIPVEVYVIKRVYLQILQIRPSDQKVSRLSINHKQVVNDRIIWSNDIFSTQDDQALDFWFNNIISL